MVVIPSVYMGPITYWSEIERADTVLIDEGEHFVKQTYRNRTEIATENGISSLIVPLEKGKNSKLALKDVKISYAENWLSLHFKTLCSAYGNAAYFDHYYPELKNIFDKKKIFLADWNEMWRSFFIEEYSIFHKKINVKKSYHEIKPEETDLRNLMHPRFRENCLHPDYYHVFFDKYQKPLNLSIIDLLLNEGPAGIQVLRKTQLIKTIS